MWTWLCWRRGDAPRGQIFLCGWLIESISLSGTLTTPVAKQGVDERFGGVIGCGPDVDGLSRWITGTDRWNF
jgi:hypothetical protein